jgi:hypothetical protein
MSSFGLRRRLGTTCIWHTIIRTQLLVSREIPVRHKFLILGQVWPRHQRNTSKPLYFASCEIPIASTHCNTKCSLFRTPKYSKNLKVCIAHSGHLAVLLGGLVGCRRHHRRLSKRYAAPAGAAPFFIIDGYICRYSRYLNKWMPPSTGMTVPAMKNRPVSELR